MFSFMQGNTYQHIRLRRSLDCPRGANSPSPRRWSHRASPRPKRQHRCRREILGKGRETCQKAAEFMIFDDIWDDIWWYLWWVSPKLGHTDLPENSACMGNKLISLEFMDFPIDITWFGPSRPFFFRGWTATAAVRAAISSSIAPCEGMSARSVGYSAVVRNTRETTW